MISIVIDCIITHTIYNIIRNIYKYMYIRVYVDMIIYTSVSEVYLYRLHIPQHSKYDSLKAPQISHPAG